MFRLRLNSDYKQCSQMMKSFLLITFNEVNMCLSLEARQQKLFGIWDNMLHKASLHKFSTRNHFRNHVLIRNFQPIFCYLISCLRIQLRVFSKSTFFLDEKNIFAWSIVEFYTLSDDVYVKLEFSTEYPEIGTKRQNKLIFCNPD